MATETTTERKAGPLGARRGREGATIKKSFNERQVWFCERKEARWCKRQVQKVGKNDSRLTVSQTYQDGELAFMGKN